MAGLLVFWPAGLVVLTIAAVALLGFGARELSLAYRILSQDPDDVLDTPAGGPVELVGTVGVEGDPLQSPFTGTECVAYEYEVQEERTRTTTTGKTTTTQTYWETIASGTDAVPFRLQDETGIVLVDPTDADLHLSREGVIRVEGGTAPPDRIARYIREDDRVDDQNRTLDLRLFELKTGRDRKFSERRLDVGGPVHVLGVARYDPSTATASGHVNAVVGAAADAHSETRWARFRTRLVGPRFIISDTTERGAGLRVALPGLVALVLGLGAFAMLGLLVM